MPPSPAQLLAHHRRHHAMATMWELHLRGEDEEHLEAVANALTDEIDRVESLLSRFDGSSEVARINREAAKGPVRVDAELFWLIERCVQHAHGTAGRFDIAHHDGGSSTQLMLDAEARTVRFHSPRLSLDFGGIGKGYALDRCESLLRRHGVRHALLHGGTSSVLALGDGPEGRGWRIGVRDPQAMSDQPEEVTHLHLQERHLSTSARHAVQGAQERTPASCTVIAAAGEAAEAWSTALLAMGDDRAKDWLAGQDELRVLWIDLHEGRPRGRWLTEPMS